MRAKAACLAKAPERAIGLAPPKRLKGDRACPAEAPAGREGGRLAQW